MKNEHKSIPELLIKRAEENARQSRQEIQEIKDAVRRNGEEKNGILKEKYEELFMYEQDIYEMREFYGSKNIIP